MFQDARDSLKYWPPVAGELLQREFFRGISTLGDDFRTVRVEVPKAVTMKDIVRRYDEKRYYPCCLQINAHLFCCKNSPWTKFMNE